MIVCIRLRYREEDRNIKQFLQKFEIILFRQCQDHRASKALRRFNNRQKGDNKIKDKEPELSDFSRNQQEEFITNLLKERMRLFDLDEHVIEPYQTLLTTLESKSTSSNEKEETKDEDVKLPPLLERMNNTSSLPSLIRGGSKKKFPRKKKNKRKTKKHTKRKTKRRRRTPMKKKIIPFFERIIFYFAIKEKKTILVDFWHCFFLFSNFDLYSFCIILFRIASSCCWSNLSACSFSIGSYEC